MSMISGSMEMSLMTVNYWESLKALCVLSQIWKTITEKWKTLPTLDPNMQYFHILSHILYRILYAPYLDVPTYLNIQAL